MTGCGGQIPLFQGQIRSVCPLTHPAPTGWTPERGVDHMNRYPDMRVVLKISAMLPSAQPEEPEEVLAAVNGETAA